VHTTNKLITVVNKTRVALQENREHIKAIESYVKILSTDAQLLSTTISHLHGRLYALEAITHYNQVIALLEATASQLEKQQRLYLKQRAALELGSLTEDILPIHELHNILSNAQRLGMEHLPWQWYYQHVKVRPQWMENDTLIYRAELPLVNHKSYLLYDIQTYPVRNGRHSVKLNAAGPVVVDTNGGEMFSPHNCVGHLPTVCRPGAAYRSGNMQCERGLLNGDPGQRKTCPLQVNEAKTSASISEIGLGQYVIETSGEAYSLNCLGQSARQEVVKEGTYLLTVSQGCVVHGEQGWSLTGVIHGFSSATIDTQMIPILPFNLTANLPPEKLAIASVSPHFKTLDDIVNIDIAQLDEQGTSLTWPIHGSDIAGTSVSVICIVIVAVALFALFLWRRKHKNATLRKRITVPVNANLSHAGIRLYPSLPQGETQQQEQWQELMRQANGSRRRKKMKLVSETAIGFWWIYRDTLLDIMCVAYITMML
jgi:hypothetical protein